MITQNNKTVYLHIGTGKTGTTALQNFLYANRHELKRQGLIYPKVGMNANAHHYLGHLWGGGWLPHELVEGLDKNKLWGDIKKIFDKGNSHLLISTESLLGTFVNHPEAMRQIKNNLGSPPIKVIVYLRRQDTFAESTYNQRIKSSMTSRLPELELSKLPKFYDYFWFLNTLSDVFGKHNIIVRPYEKRQFVGDSIFSDFLSLLGIEWSESFKVPTVIHNPSLSREALEFVRLINSITAPSEAKLAYINVVRNYSFENNEQRVFSQQKILSPAHRINILKQYESSNQQVAKNFLNRDDGQLFNEPWPEQDEPWIAFQGLSAEKSISMALELWTSAEKNKDLNNRSFKWREFVRFIFYKFTRRRF